MSSGNDTSSPSVRKLAKLFETNYIVPNSTHRFDKGSVFQKNNETDIIKEGKILSTPQYEGAKENTKHEKAISSTSVRGDNQESNNERIGELTPKQNTLTPSDEIIQSRRKLLIVGLKEHLNSSKESNGCKDSYLDENEHDDTNASFDDDTTEPLVITPNRSNHVASTSCMHQNENTGNALVKSLSIQQTPTELVSEDEEFTISRSSIENFVKTSIDTKEPTKDPSSYFSRIIKHCQSSINHFTTSRVLKQSLNGTPSNSSQNSNVMKNRESTDYQVNINTGKIRTGVSAIFTNISGNQAIKHVSISLDCLGEGIDKATNFLYTAQSSLKSKLVIGKIIIKSLVRASKLSIVANISFLISMITSLYPTTPRINCCMFGLLFIISTKQNWVEQHVFVMLSIVTLITIIDDFDWLISDYVPKSLDSNQDDFSFIVEQETSLMRSIVWYLTIVGIALRFIMVVAIIRTSKHGHRLSKRVWKNIYVYFPPFSALETGNVDLEGRVFAIIWFESICAFLTIAITIYTHMYLNWSPIFTTALPLTPLVNMLYTKGITGLMYVIGILHHFASFSRPPCLYKIRPTLSQIDASFIQFNGVLKIIDTIVSVLVWISLVMSKDVRRFDQPKEVRVTFGVIVILVSLSSIYGLMLALVVYWNRFISVSAASPGTTSHFGNDSNLVYISTYNSPVRHLVLDSNVQCTPTQFEQEWKIMRLSDVSFQEKEIIMIPPIEQCCSHFSLRRIYSVAAGGFNSNHGFQIYLVAQTDSVRFLGELRVDRIRKLMSMKIKSNDLSAVPYFFQLLQLNRLFGIS